MSDPKLAVDAKGFVWWAWDDGWQMVNTTTDNEPISQPVRFYRPEHDLYEVLAENRELRKRIDGLNAAVEDSMRREIARHELLAGVEPKEQQT